MKICKKILILCFVLTCCFSLYSCTKEVQHAQEEVTRLDSLQNIGEIEPDSVLLSELYAILHPYRYFYLKEYAHICYYYAYMYCKNGNYISSVPYYIKVLSYAPQHEDDILAHAYRNLTGICHLGGYNRLAYELNEKAIYHFKRAYNHYEYEMAMCRKAVLKYILGSADESITLLQYISQQSKNGIVKARTEEYISLLIEDRTPVLVNTTRQLNATELYTAVEDIKYELQRKPFLWRTFLILPLVIKAVQLYLQVALYRLDR